MVFSSTVFLFLFIPLLLILYFLPVGEAGGAFRRKWRNAVLLIFSIGFYAWGEPAFVFVMLLSVLINWAIALAMAKSEHGRKAWLSTAVILDILLLVVFKYTGFITENIAALTGNSSIIVSIALPIGISFFTFQMMSYVFDVYYGNAEVQRNPLKVALYITLFPQMIAGPIVRYRQIADEITSRRESFEDFSQGVRRFIYGLGKKVLLANFLAQIADNIFDGFPNPSVMMCWLGAVAYTLQIYFDFSGYSDMAIGLGRMFGFHFEENFNYPYTANSITEYWKRWHISLSTWFRDYVYIPLGGNRVSRGRWVLNMFIIWLLTGIWHGANWTYIIWGLLNLAFLLLEKRVKVLNRDSWLNHVYTMAVTAIIFVVFRSADITSAVQYIGRMFGIGVSCFAEQGFVEYIKGTYVILILSVIGCTPLLKNVFGRLSEKGFAFAENIWLTAVFVASVLQVTCSSYNPFIYFNF